MSTSAAATTELVTEVLAPSLHGTGSSMLSGQVYSGLAAYKAGWVKDMPLGSLHRREYDQGALKWKWQPQQRKTDEKWTHIDNWERRELLEEVLWARKRAGTSHLYHDKPVDEVSDTEKTQQRPSTPRQKQPFRRLPLTPPTPVVTTNLSAEVEPQELSLCEGSAGRESSGSRRRNLHWNEDEEAVLLDLYAAECSHAKNNTNLKTCAWGRIAKALQERFDKDFTLLKCKDKVYNLKSTYKDLKKAQKPSGSAPVTWSHYPVLDYLLSRDVNIGFPNGFDNMKPLRPSSASVGMDSANPFGFRKPPSSPPAATSPSGESKGSDLSLSLDRLHGTPLVEARRIHKQNKRMREGKCESVASNIVIQKLDNLTAMLKEAEETRLKAMREEAAENRKFFKELFGSRSKIRINEFHEATPATKEVVKENAREDGVTSGVDVTIQPGCDPVADSPKD